MIESCHCVIALLTSDSLQSKWVQQEIGLAKGLSKKIVPLVTRGVSPPAMLEGIEYYRFSRNNPARDFGRIAAFICEFAKDHGLKLTKSTEVPREDFQILHLPHALLCPKCKNVEIHVFVSFLCGEWVCVNCGETIPPTSRAQGPKGK